MPEGGGTFLFAARRDRSYTRETKSYGSVGVFVAGGRQNAGDVGGWVVVMMIGRQFSLTCRYLVGFKLFNPNGIMASLTK